MVSGTNALAGLEGIDCMFKESALDPWNSPWHCPAHLPSNPFTVSRTEDR